MKIVDDTPSTEPVAATSELLLSTTPSIEGKTIHEYCGIVTGSAHSKLLSRYGEQEGLSRAIERMADQALRKGANAVVGISIDWESIAGATIPTVFVSGTAVTVR